VVARKTSSYWNPQTPISKAGCRLLGLSTDKERGKKFAEELWKLNVPSSIVFRYYDGLLYMMCVLHASGEFKAIMPKH